MTPTQKAVEAAVKAMKALEDEATVDPENIFGADLTSLAKAALTAALAVDGLCLVPGWQPIESAPKDGRYLLLCGQHSRSCGYPVRMLVCRWDGCAWESADDGYGVYLKPTHWQQLPSPPAASDGEERVSPPAGTEG